MSEIITTRVHGGDGTVSSFVAISAGEACRALGVTSINAYFALVEDGYLTPHCAGGTFPMIDIREVDALTAQTDELSFYRRANFWDEPDGAD